MIAGGSLFDREDAFGQYLLDFHESGETGEAFLERDDGYERPALAAEVFFEPAEAWPAEERDVVGQAGGRVLDIGCGAGRHALHLQSHGHPVVALDISPKAVEVSRRRGVSHARVAALEQIDASLGGFDALLLMCGNFGLFGSLQHARSALTRLSGIVNSGGLLIFESVDPGRITDEAFVRYRASNRRSGRADGQVTLRFRYGDRVTPWADLLNVGRGELPSLLADSGWEIERLCGSADSPSYYGVLRRS